MTLVIHAGIHRTGTTSLQRFLAENRAALAGRGVGYPGEENNHQALAWALHRGQAARGRCWRSSAGPDAGAVWC